MGTLPGHSLNLSISLWEGAEINEDSPGSGERPGNSPDGKPPFGCVVKEVVEQAGMPAHGGLQALATTGGMSSPAW